MANTYIGEENASSKRVTQVYEATHVGEQYLPYMRRSFISFSFGGKNIEDFGLIAYTNGDRVQRQGSSNFNNLTTSTDVLNGQLYWGTFFQGNTLNLELATDGITQPQLDDFLRWFRGGETRELILAEHPNRGILARVAEPPTLSLLPFETSASINLRYTDFTTSTTLYRGEISLSFQMDDPFWYSINNVFGEYNEEEGYYEDVWIDANNQKINVFDPTKNKDAIKIMLEDGIPLSSMVQNDMLFGNNIVARTSQTDGAIIAKPSFIFRCTKETDSNDNSYILVAYYRLYIDTLDDNDPNKFPVDFYENPEYTIIFDENLITLGDRASDFEAMFGTSDIQELLEQLTEELGENDSFITTIWKDIRQNCIVSDDNRIQGVLMTAEDGVDNLPKNNYNINFYYAGTAPAYPTLEFTLVPAFNTDQYIFVPANRFARQPDLGDKTFYNTLTIESENKCEFKFTTPNIYTSYNTAIQIFKNNSDGSKLVDDIYSLIRDNVKHYAVRAWAVRILDELKGNSQDEEVVFQNASAACNSLRQLFMTTGEQPEITPASFKFDSKTGIATGTFTIRDIGTGFPNSQEMKEIVENVGDMVKSDWLVIKDRNRPTSDNLIRGWTDNNLLENGKLFSHRIYHNVEGGLKHVKLTYNNMYL